MYFKKPVIVKLDEEFFIFSEHYREGQCLAVMELDKAKEFIRFFKKICKKYAYSTWLEAEKNVHPCILCSEDNPNALVYHHLGKKYTGMSKTDRIANMIANQRPLYEIVHEMSKCTILCAACHQKIEREGDEARDDIYDIYNRLFGDNSKFCVVDRNYAPGDETSESLDNRIEFRKNMQYVPIEIVASFEPAYLESLDEGFSDYVESVTEDNYMKNRSIMRRNEIEN